MKKNIQILSDGCKKCNTLTELVKNVVSELAIPADIQVVNDVSIMMSKDVLSTPALLINDVVIMKGRVPSKEEVIGYIRDEKKCKTAEEYGQTCSHDTCF